MGRENLSLLSFSLNSAVENRAFPEWRCKCGYPVGFEEFLKPAKVLSDWLCLIMVAKAPHPARAALKPALHTGLGGKGSAGGLMVSPKKTPGVCCAVLYKVRGFHATFASVGCCHCNNISSLLPGRRQNTGVKR